VNAPGAETRSHSMLAWTIAAGAVLGVTYTLSPLTVLVLGSSPLIWRWASRDLSDRERHWLAIVLLTAIVIRLVAIAAVFLSASPSMPYANLFGDEDFFKRRSIWIRNIGLGLPISSADYLYAFDDVGRTAYLYVLAFVQAVVGDAPYGMLLLNAAIYIAGMLALYRLARSVYGGLAALGGLTMLLFLPSLFAWSISALKEPPYMCLGAVEIVAAVALVRGKGVWRRRGAGVCAVACAIALQAVRDGGLILAVFGVGGGLIAAVLVTRRRWLLASMVAVPLVAFAVVRQPAVQRRLPDLVYAVAYKHWGQVLTPGYAYPLLDPEFYDFDRRAALRDLTALHVGRYVVRAFTAYAIVPAPWQIDSTAALAYLPEQVVWYVLAVLAPVGAWKGLRRDPLVTTLLVCHAAIAALMVAFITGNVGTLVRHRGLALPFIVWLSALGAVELGRFVARGAPASSPVLAASKA
jgi:hypothetical protein